MNNYQWNVEYPSDVEVPEHEHINKDTRIMQKPITLGIRWHLHPNQEHSSGDQTYLESFPRRYPKTMIRGGTHRTRKLFIYGTQWTVKIGIILWQNLSQRANERYGKQGTKNGHQPYKRRASTSSSTYAKTSKWNTGDSRSKDGDGKEKFIPPRPRSLANVGWKLPQMYQQGLGNHLQRFYWHHNTMSGKIHTQLTWKTTKNCTCWSPNQDSWGPSVLKWHARWGMAPATLQRDQWERVSVTSVSYNGPARTEDSRIQQGRQRSGSPEL